MRFRYFRAELCLMKANTAYRSGNILYKWRTGCASALLRQILGRLIYRAADEISIDEKDLSRAVVITRQCRTGK